MEPMTHPVPPPAGQSDHRDRHAVGVVGEVLFALAPWLSLGIATPVAFIVAAVLFSHLGKVHAVVLWLSAAVYTTAVITIFADNGASASIVCGLICMVGGGIQAIVFAILAAERGYRPLCGRAARTWATRIAGTAFTIAVVMILVYGLAEDASFQRHHQDASATIVSVRSTTQCFGAPVPSCTDQHRPTVRFTTGQGEVVETETRDFYAKDSLKSGNVITVHYDPSDPREVRLGTGWDDSDVAIIVMCGALGIALAAVSWARRRRRSNGPHAAWPASDGPP
jgi:hypothetical protein